MTEHAFMCGSKTFDSALRTFVASVGLQTETVIATNFKSFSQSNLFRLGDEQGPDQDMK